jgi:hypothetical protein
MIDEAGRRSTVQAQNLDELGRLLFLRAYDTTQERRHEWWCLWRLLCASKMRFKFKFSIRIEKCDPPDFVIQHGRYRSELEITKATFQRYEETMRGFRDMKGNMILELDPSLFSDRKFKRKDGPNAWRQYVSEPTDLHGRGTTGNEPEQIVATAISTPALRYYGFASGSRASYGWLSIGLISWWSTSVGRKFPCGIGALLEIPLGHLQELLVLGKAPRDVRRPPAPGIFRWISTT